MSPCAFCPFLRPIGSEGRAGALSQGLHALTWVGVYPRQSGVKPDLLAVTAMLGSLPLAHFSFQPLQLDDPALHGDGHGFGAGGDV